MAKVLFGNGVSSILGSIAGNTYANNRYGAYIRNKTPPVQPRSEYQLNQRALFAAISGSWRGLTAEEQAGWNAAASAKMFVITNRFGNTVSLSGATLYNQINLNLSLAGQAMISLVPTPAALPVITFSALADSGANAVTANDIEENGAAPSGDYLYSVYCTTNLSPGKSFVSNLYRLLLSGATPTLTEPKIQVGSEFNTRFGLPTAGSQLFLKLIAINSTTGQATVAAASSCIVS